MASTDAWGIEIGANAIKALHLVGDRKSGLTVANYEVLPFKSVLTAPDVNAEEAIQLNLDQLVNRHDLSNANVVLSVPGHMAFARFAKLPPVDPKKIPDIVRFEAQQQIPFPIDQVEWDYQVFAQEDSPDVEVGIFAITKDRVMQFLANIRPVKIQPDALTLSPLAVYNAMAYDLQLEQEESGTIFMDIGTTSTDVIIVEGGRIWLRTLPIGGNNFTEALVRAFNLSFAKAEKLKREASTSKYARQIFQAMRPVFADLVQEMQRSIGFFQSLNRDAKLGKVVGLGSTFRLPGLMKFLKQQLQMEVTRPDGFKRLSVEGRMEADFAQHAVNLATAYGLALQGLELERVSANILPPHLIKQRIWKSKQPWVIAAAAMIAAASGLAMFNYMLTARAGNQSKQTIGPQIETVINTAEQYVGQIKQVKGADHRAKIENLRRILDYRDVWPKLIHDITMAFKAIEPQPELLEANYEKMLAIPRPERRNIVIESITADYQFMWDEAQQDTGKRAPVAVRIEDIWAGQSAGPDPSMPGYDPMMDPAMGGWRPGAPRSINEIAPAANQPTAQKPPTFVITIKGTTPHREASKLINHHFLKWLQDQPLGHTRPYTIVAGPESVTEFAMFPEDGSAEGERRPGTRGTTRFDDVGMPGVDPPVNERFGGRFDAPSGFNAPRRVEQPVELGPLLPERPGSDERRSRDWRFEIKFTVQLKSPDEARAAFRGDVPDAAPAPDGGAPDGDQPEGSDESAPATPPAAAADHDEVQS